MIAGSTTKPVTEIARKVRDVTRRAFWKRENHLDIVATCRLSFLRATSAVAAAFSRQCGQRKWFPERCSVVVGVGCRQPPQGRALR
jgi:hypothetical protein